MAESIASSSSECKEESPVVLLVFARGSLSRVKTSILLEDLEIRAREELSAGLGERLLRYTKEVPDPKDMRAWAATHPEVFNRHSERILVKPTQIGSVQHSASWSRGRAHRRHSRPIILSRPFSVLIAQARALLGTDGPPARLSPYPARNSPLAPNPEVDFQLRAGIAQSTRWGTHHELKQ